MHILMTGLGSGFLNVTPYVQEKNWFTAKDNSSKTVHRMGKIFSNHKSEKGLLTRIHTGQQ